MLKAKETVLEIDLKALKHNFNYLKSRLNTDTHFLAVVKAFTYGNEAAAIANCLQDLGANYFAVAYTNEGVALRNAGITKPILVLHPQAVNFNTIIKYQLEPSIYSFKILHEFLRVTKQQKTSNYPIHLKFNTGLNRLGFIAHELKDLLHVLKHNKNVKAKSIFSHLAASEDLNEKDFTLEQIARFKSISHEFENIMGYQPIKHLCNTSGVLNYPEAQFNMVRCGIGLYGFGNSALENKNLIPVGRLKTIISQIHTLNAGDTIGYNRAYTCTQNQKIATLPIGHADGIGRPYGNGKGYVTINGRKAPTVGNVCMDMIMVNVTNINCNEGDEVIVFDTQNTAEQLANTTNTISYELITGISQRVKRVILS